MTEGGTTVVLFDVGGVVIRTPFELHGYAWRGPFDPSSDDLWRQSQRGEITEREYWHRRARAYHPDADDPTHDFMRDLYEQEESRIVRPEVVTLLDTLDDAGLRRAVLTNDLAAFHPPEWIERMSVLRRFDPVVDLSHVGFLKPHPEAFDHALKELGIPREEAARVVFVDDQRRNVAGAMSVGMRGVWFDPTDVEGAVARLRAEIGLSE